MNEINLLITQLLIVQLPFVVLPGLLQFKKDSCAFGQWLKFDSAATKQHGQN